MIFSWLTSQIAEWPPWAQGAAFFLSTFVLEDVATVGAGLLAAAGAVSWQTAFWACFPGIWLGDAGLYLVGRMAGRSWVERRGGASLRERVARSERRFSRWGGAILVFSRLLPGARLPTYLAAGFLRWPAGRFFLLTGAASLVWTGVLLLLTQAVGGRLAAWARVYQHSGWVVLGVVAIVLLVRWRRRGGERAGWRHWEFWPAWLFYAPVAAHYLWLALRHRGLMTPTAANPGIFTGGLVGESKVALLDELFATSPGFTAPAALVEGIGAEDRLRSLEALRSRLGIGYPFVLKPDVGQRGAGVRVIRTPAEAEAYLRGTDAPVLVQRHAPGPLEAGIFYYRFPGEPRGRIFSITEKVFPEIVGDGLSTVEALVRRDPRARFMAGVYLGRLAARRDEVVPRGQSVRLVETGNHAQGCIFRDGRHLWSPELERRIDEISRGVGGFYIGRYDVRYARESDLMAGRGFEIVELNGAASEATSAYDARHSLWEAYRTLFRQWELVFAIGAANRARGARPTRPGEVWRQWRAYRLRAKGYPAGS